MKEKDLKIGDLYKITLTFAFCSEFYLYRGKMLKTTSFGSYTVYEFFNLSTMKNVDMPSAAHFESL